MRAIAGGEARQPSKTRSTLTAVTISGDQHGNFGPDDVTINCEPEEPPPTATPTASPTPNATETPTATPTDAPEATPTPQPPADAHRHALR